MESALSKVSKQELALSSPILPSSLHKAFLELECLYTASDCLIAYNVLINKWGNDSSADVPVFWLHSKAALMASFTMNWCKLFGSDSTDRFWKQVTLEQKAFRELVYTVTEFNYQGWADYRKMMTAFRNKVVSHPTPYFDCNDVPDFSAAFDVLKVTHKWLRQVAEYIDEPVVGNLSNREYFENIAIEIDRSVSSC
ncbi:hypothetical protein A9Q81_14155 [Gammaproteobacteria bacterium 42_54_T18]|nr:hypothetical protein A9Q81_14155 [Gammaproteobacteria bacterium 42_54_T18]